MRFWIIVIIAFLGLATVAEARMNCTYRQEDGREGTFPVEISDQYDSKNVTFLQRVKVDKYVFELLSFKTVYYIQVRDLKRNILKEYSDHDPDSESINLTYDGFFIDCTDDGAVEPELEETEPVDPT